VVLAAVDPTHRVLRLGTNASEVSDSTIHPTSTASCSVPTCYAAARGYPSVASGVVMLVGGWLCAPVGQVSRNALVSSALGSEHYCTVQRLHCTARFVDAVTAQLF
jgi:hypothetical protein